MTGRLVDMSFSLNRKQRITLEVDSDFRSLWDKLNQEPLLDIEIKKHRNKRSRSRWASPPRTSGSNGSRVPPVGSSPATRRATLTISRSSMTATTCRSKGG